MWDGFTCAELFWLNFEDLGQVVQCFLVLEQHRGKEVFDIVDFAIWLGPSHHSYPQTVKFVIHQCEAVPKKYCDDEFELTLELGESLANFHTRKRFHYLTECLVPLCKHKGKFCRYVASTNVCYRHFRDAVTRL